MTTVSTVFAKEITSVTIEDELKRSYLDYAMSVIVGRALPDVRDGLKPVHRRVLFAMHELSNDWNKPYKKSARVVGDVIGKYHPHGDTAVYDTIVRMAQPFSMRYILIDGQGNFGSVDGDSPAAMRYTEIRMSKFAHQLLSDLDKDTVDFVPNYDETEHAPLVLPTRIPNLLVNGSSGIAVGMATNIPPHNLNEVVDACLALINEGDLSIDQLMHYIKGPDFPTQGIINGRGGIVEAYKTGKGRIYIRAKTHIEEKEKHSAIVITELPYQVNKARLIERIAELIREKKLEGITGLRDESDKDGMRVVIELRRNEMPEVLLNNLYTHTAMQNVFGINLVALDHGEPKLFNLKQMLEAFITHRREVVTRRTQYELKKANARAHILEGLGIALSNIDEMIALIKQSKNPSEAKAELITRPWKPDIIIELLKRSGVENTVLKAYYLSDLQAQAILELRLHRLTGLEQERIFAEYQEILDLIRELKAILADDTKLMQIIREELIDIKNTFGDERKTEIIESQEDILIEDLITEEDRVVTLSHEGYVKTQSLALYQAQKRGGKGKIATDIKDEDFVERLLIASTHDTILCFSDRGKVYWLKVYQLPQAARNARGKPIINVLSLAPNERINAILPIREYLSDQYVFMATSQGKVKKVPLKEFSRPRSNGIIAMNLLENDYLIGAALTQKNQHVLLFTDAGKVVHFREEEIRPMGRTAQGVRGIRIKPGQKVIALIITEEKGVILTTTQNGYGKRTDLSEYRITSRGAQGVISIKTSARNGKVVGAISVNDNDEVMFISDQGTLVRTRINEISCVGRNAQGVRLIRLSDSEKLVSVARIEEEDLVDVSASELEGAALT